MLRSRVSLNRWRSSESVSTSTPPVMALRLVAAPDPMALARKVMVPGATLPTVPTEAHWTGTSMDSVPATRTMAWVEEKNN